MERQFKGIWIPASIVLDENLTPFEKILIAEIDGLSGKDGPCYASCQHFAKIMQSTIGSVRTILSRLTKQGYLITLGSDGITTWRCVHPKYSSDLGQYSTWMEDKKLPEAINEGLRGCQSALMGASTSIDGGASTSVDIEILSKRDTNRKQREEQLPPGDVKRSSGGVLCSQEEVTEYCLSLGLTQNDAQSIYNSWQANGFRTKTGPIRNWQASVRTWKCNSWFPSQQQQRFSRPLNSELIDEDGFICEMTTIGRRRKVGPNGKYIRATGK